MAWGILSILKFDAIFVSIPSNVIAAASNILFGVLAMSAIESLSRVKWDQLNFVVPGPAFMLSIGGLFVASTTLAHFPLIVRQVIARARPEAAAPEPSATGASARSGVADRPEPPRAGSRSATVH